MRYLEVKVGEAYIIKKNGAHCLTMAPFVVVTSTGQIPNHFMHDLKKLAYFL